MTRLRRSPLVLLLVLLGWVSCDNPLVEKVTETYPDGTPRTVRFYKEKDGVQDLVREIQYHPNHQKFYEGEFKNNKKHGSWTVWYKNGNKWSEGEFKNGMDDGLRTTYHENGQINFKGKYRNGEMVGTWRFYDVNGKQVKEIDYDKK